MMRNCVSERNEMLGARLKRNAIKKEKYYEAIKSDSSSLK
jgi:hypothetical protein